MYRERAMQLQSGGADMQTPIEPGQQTLLVWVSGRWQFEGESPRR
jgi:hypothetical protein